MKDGAYGKFWNKDKDCYTVGYLRTTAGSFECTNEDQTSFFGMFDNFEVIIKDES
jgi:hypothetical protein